MRINIGSLLSYRATTYPREEIAVDSQYRLTQFKLNQYVNQLAHWLRNQNIKSGDRVAILSRNNVHTFAIFLAIAKVGAIILPINCSLNSLEIRYILEDSGAKMVFFEEFLQKVKNDLQDLKTIQQYISISNVLNIMENCRLNKMIFGY
jgi:acyl-CoA synthetase (AMP-forming)/AMP-acid ligase II